MRGIGLDILPSKKNKYFRITCRGKKNFPNRLHTGSRYLINPYHRRRDATRFFFHLPHLPRRKGSQNRPPPTFSYLPRYNKKRISNQNAIHPPPPTRNLSLKTPRQPPPKHPPNTLRSSPPRTPRHNQLPIDRRTATRQATIPGPRPSRKWSCSYRYRHHLRNAPRQADVSRLLTANYKQ